MRVADVLGLGSLRYPGGTPTSYWNYTNGRWIDSNTWVYANRTRAMPEGTWTPKQYMRGIGRKLHTPPVWNLNLGMLGTNNIEEPRSQIDTLRDMGVPVEYLELDNEKADEDFGNYIAKAENVSAHARTVFPQAKVSIIGCFKLDWN